MVAIHARLRDYSRRILLLISANSFVNRLLEELLVGRQQLRRRLELGRPLHVRVAVLILADQDVAQVKQPGQRL